MIRTTMAVVGLGLLLSAPVSFAKDNHESDERFTYASYFWCDAGEEGPADEYMSRNSEIMDQMVEDGDILSYGWMGHHTGGLWRRIRWHQADSLEGAIMATDAMAEAIADEYGEDDEGGMAFSKACPRHVDYVWQVQDGTVGAERGTVGFSVYHRCDIPREERADEIVSQHVAPIMNKLVEDGMLASWGWQSHVIGGGIRRLQTMSAKDLPTLLKARTASIEAIYGDDNEAGAELVEICGPHADYIWNIIEEGN